MKKKYAIIIASLSAALLAVGGVLIFTLIQLNSTPHFHLDSEYYAESEAVDIDKEKYEQLISGKKSFIIMVDKPDCFTTANMREYMANFPGDMQFKYYRIMWSEAKDSSLHQYIKFTPSVAVVREGEVIDWLQADKDEDTEYFNSSEALQSWIKKYIEF